MGLADQSDKVMNWHGVFNVSGIPTYVCLGSTNSAIWGPGFCTNLVLICEFLSLQMINYG